MYVGERQVGDPPRGFIDRDRVADPDRLREGEEQSGERVRQHLPRGQAQHEAQHRARGQETGRELVELGELVEGQEAADQDDHDEGQPANDAKARLRRARDTGLGDASGDAAGMREDEAIHYVRDRKKVM